MDTIFDGEVPRARLALLLRHFSELKDNREPWRIVYPLQEVLLLVTCATIASCDDFDDIVAWGKHHLVFLRHFSEYRSIITAFPASAGSAPSSIGSIRSCSAAVSTAGLPRCGRTGTNSSPSTAKRHAGPTTNAKGLKPCIRSVPTPPMQG